MAISAAQLKMLVTDRRFNQDGLMEIYKIAQSTDLEKLLCTTHELFPDRLDES